MKIQVRYYSRSGNTKLLAEEIAKECNVKAISIDDKKASIDKKTDILFIGGALYMYGIDKKLKQYISELNPNNINKAIVFSTTSISKHSISIIKKLLKDKGINVSDKYIYARSKPNNKELNEARIIVKNSLK